jgi:hypothetical protein
MHDVYSRLTNLVENQIVTKREASVTRSQLVAPSTDVWVVAQQLKMLSRLRDHDTLCGYALNEPAVRKQSLPARMYSAALRLYRTPKFTFAVHGYPGWVNFLLR